MASVRLFSLLTTGMPWRDLPERFGDWKAERTETRDHIARRSARMSSAWRVQVTVR
jgi:transposase